MLFRSRRGDILAAAGLLEDAEHSAPLRIRLDPYARELLAVLPHRTTDAAVAGRLREAAARAGLRVG